MNFDKKYIGMHPELFLPDASPETIKSFLSMFGFYSTNKELSLEDEPKEFDGWGKFLDKKNKYFKDSRGYRNLNEEKFPEIIAAGCSQTYGIGVPEEVRWSNQLAKLTKMSHLNISLPGWSTQNIINGVMSHIQERGKPKIVALLLPDFFRYDTIVNSFSMKNKWGETNDGFLNKIENVRRMNELTSPYDVLPKISKKPHISKEILSAEHSYFLSGQFLRFFIEYCKEANIKLIWGTWHSPLHEVVSYVKSINTKHITAAPYTDFSGYVDVGYRSHVGKNKLIEEYSSINCHKNLKNLYSECFDRGLDIHPEEKAPSHMGAHAHIHVAESFYRQLVRNKN